MAVSLKYLALCGKSLLPLVYMINSVSILPLRKKKRLEIETMIFLFFLEEEKTLGKCHKQ